MSDSKPSSTDVLFTGITGFDKTAIISKLAQDLLRREGLPPNLRHPESSKIVRHIKFDDVLKKVSGAYDIPSFLESQSLAEKTAAIERSFEKITKNLQANGYPKYVFIEINLSYI